MSADSEITDEKLGRLKMFAQGTLERVQEAGRKYREAKEVYEGRRAGDWLDPTRLSYWYSIVKHVVNTPATSVVFNPFDFGGVMDGEKPQYLEEIADRIILAGRAVSGGSGEFFLRTDFTSGKHEWNDTCGVNAPDRFEVVQRMCRLIEFSACHDIPFDNFVVREMLKPKVWFTAFYGQMPITREFRLFLEGGEVTHLQAYWPLEAFKGQPTSIPFEEVGPALETMADLSFHDRLRLKEYAYRIHERLPGDWSMDFMDLGDDKWYLTDMAVANRSHRHEALPPL